MFYRRIHVFIFSLKIFEYKLRAHPEKCETVFGWDVRENKYLERRSDAIGSKCALRVCRDMCGFAKIVESFLSRQLNTV
ncbi:hypothetical protein BRY73_06260 [Ochrobactrum sp. P6BS-III]|nr:hypothetical protein BRY73_06260 [Ochrobactrum sp. P6BS-III]